MTAASVEERVRAALARRAALLASPDTNAFRLVHRAADGFPQLAVDRYAEVLVAHLYTAGQAAAAPRAVLENLARAVGATALYIKQRPTQANQLRAAERAALAPAHPMWGQPRDEVTALENGLQYVIRPGAGLSVGLFLDMRETRAWVRQHAAGKTVLNCFAYTAGFGVAAAAGGAARVVNLDIARRALEWGQRNYELNGLAWAPRDFITGDTFDWLRRFGRRAERFDLVIVDPPSYSSTKNSRFTVQRDYAALAALAASLVAPGGWLVACANAAELPAAAFLKQLRAGLESHPARIRHIAHEPALDFPVARGEHPYLKIAFARFEPSA